jgi:imidazolonepropionase-like amidohydrolase
VARHPQPHVPIAFVHVNVVPMDQERVLLNQTVIVSDSRIVAVGPSSTTVIPANVQRIEARNKYLIPGLTDAHVHLQTPLEFSVFLANGVTTVFNLDGRPAHLAWRKRISGGEMLGPTIFTTGPIFTQAHPVDVALKMVDEQAALGYDAVKIYNGVSKEEYPALIAEAKKKNLLLMGHVARKPDFELTLSSGQSIAHLEEYTYTFFNPKRDDDDSHIVYDEAKIPEAVRLTVKAGIFVTPTLANYATIVQQATALDEFLKNTDLRYDAPWVLDGFQPETDRYKNGFDPAVYPRLRESLALQRKLVKALQEGGVPLLSGTDASAVGPVAGFGLHEELQEFVNDGFTPYQALQTATTNPARYFRRSDEFGTISAGKRADLLLLAGNPLVDIANTRKIDGVMVQGRWMDHAALKEMLEKVPERYAEGIRRVEELLKTNPEKLAPYLEENDPYDNLAAAGLERRISGEDAQSLTATLKNLRKQLPGSTIVSEAAINSLGYHLLQEKKYECAVAALRLNTEDFPRSANTWDSLGEVLFKTGDVQGGLANYKKALEVDPKYPNAEVARKFIAVHEAVGKSQ